MKFFNKECFRQRAQCFGLHHCGRCFLRNADRYPRFFSILFGIIVPLLLLDMVAIFMGYWISGLESPYEIAANDAHLEAVAYTEFYSLLLANITAYAPQVCLEFYQTNKTIVYVEGITDDFSNIFLNEETNQTEKMLAILLYEKVYFPAIEDVRTEFNETVYTSSDNTQLVNMTDLSVFLIDCGEQFRSTVQKIFKENLSEITSQGQLTFGWNRCSPYQHNRTLTQLSDFQRSLRPVSIEVLEYLSLRIWQSILYSLLTFPVD